MTTTQVARFLEVNESRVRQLADEGRLGPIERNPLGRIFSRIAVAAYKATRRRA